MSSPPPGLVGGEAVGDEWVVRGERAERRRRTEDVIRAGEARAVAALARRAEAIFGTPQDVEWAIAGGELFMLQARPMTALPEVAAWVPPHKGWWLRNFRLGEWLPEPVTPLFESWLMPALGRGVTGALAGESGLSVALDDAVINGWYYNTPQPRAVGRPLARQLLRHPGALVELPTILLLLRPDWVTGALVRMSTHWNQVLLPRYRRAVERAEAVARDAPPAALVGVVDRVAEVAGEYFWSVATLAGSQWKLEAVLARFVRAHIPGVVESAQVLMIGLPGVQGDLPGHAVHSVDWYWPTAGELGHAAPADRHRELATRREAMQTRCRAALAGSRRARRRFERLLELAQHYAVVREQQTRLFTLGWPVLRRCALRLGAHLTDKGLIDGSEDVFFLIREELDVALAGLRAEPLHAVVERRRTEWERQRRLVAPLEVGTAPWLARVALARAVSAARTGPAAAEGAIVGQPASPGRATGPVRLITDPAEFDRFAAGEVLVARATAPAWTPLFGKAAAVVTDGGTLAAHASLVAREYGIPAVVATGDATARLRDGQIVTVDGGAGVVEVQ